MFKLSEAAARDIEIIFENSITQFGIQQTEIYYSSLKKCFDLLNKNPRMGTEAVDVDVDVDVRKGYRRFPHQSHVVFYQVIDDGIFIVRILHKRMDIEKHFDE